MDKELAPIWVDIKDEAKVHRIIKHLESFRGGPFISLYLPHIPNEDFLSRWNSLYHIERNGVESSDIKETKRKEIIELLDNLDRAINEIGEFEYYHTLVIFMGVNFMYIIDLPTVEEEVMNISNRIFLDPLEDHIEDQKSLVFCVDREEVRIFTIYLDRFDKLLSEFHSDVPKRVRGGTESWRGNRDDKILRHIDWHLNEHLKKARGEFLEVYKSEKPGKIYIGGHEMIIPRITSKLPKEVRMKIFGKFKAEPDLFVHEAREEGFGAIRKHMF